MDQGQQFPKYDAKTMGSVGNLTEEHMTPGNSEAPDWDKHYGTSFRWGYVPDENWIGPKDAPKTDRVGLVANLTPDFHKWEDAQDHPVIQEWKKNWKEKWKTIPSYKQNQILAAINHGEKND